MGSMWTSCRDLGCLPEGEAGISFFKLDDFQAAETQNLLLLLEQSSEVFLGEPTACPPKIWAIDPDDSPDFGILKAGGWPKLSIWQGKEKGQMEKGRSPIFTIWKGKDTWFPPTPTHVPGEGELCMHHIERTMLKKADFKARVIPLCQDLRGGSDKRSPREGFIHAREYLCVRGLPRNISKEHTSAPHKRAGICLLLTEGIWNPWEKPSNSTSYVTSPPLFSSSPSS